MVNPIPYAYLPNVHFMLYYHIEPLHALIMEFSLILSKLWASYYIVFFAWLCVFFSHENILSINKSVVCLPFVCVGGIDSFKSNIYLYKAPVIDIVLHLLLILDEGLNFTCCSLLLITSLQLSMRSIQKAVLSGFHSWLLKSILDSVCSRLRNTSLFSFSRFLPASAVELFMLLQCWFCCVACAFTLTSTSAFCLLPLVFYFVADCCSTFCCYLWWNYQCCALI